jgi:hypothetical protein
MTSLGTVRIGGFTFCLAVACALATPLMADINLEWRPESQTGQVDGLVEIGLYVVSDDPEMDQLLSALDVIIAWEPAYLELSGVTGDGNPNWIFSGFSNDPYGLNETIPPQDGDGLYTALAALGTPVHATPEGTLVITFQFTALAVTDETPLEILESAGSPPGRTIVYDGTVPNLDVTGTLGSARVEIVCQLCPGDVNEDAVVDLVDLAVLLAHYGITTGASPSDGDLDCDGDVDLDDLARLLAVYGTACE